MNLYHQIKELAVAKKISVAQLERDLDFSNGSISKWGNSLPSIDKVENVADYFGVSVDYLLGRESKEDAVNSELAFMFRKHEEQVPEDKREQYRKEMERFMSFVSSQMNDEEND